MTKYQKLVAFARFCTLHRLHPMDAAELIRLSDIAFKAGVREANTGKSADAARDRVITKASAMRLKTYWPGLAPAFRRGRGASQQDIHLPDC